MQFYDVYELGIILRKQHGRNLNKLKFQWIFIQSYHTKGKYCQEHYFCSIVFILLMKVYQVKTFTRLRYQT